MKIRTSSGPSARQKDETTRAARQSKAELRFVLRLESCGKELLHVNGPLSPSRTLRAKRRYSSGLGRCSRPTRRCWKYGPRGQALPSLLAAFVLFRVLDQRWIGGRASLALHRGWLAEGRATAGCGQALASDGLGRVAQDGNIFSRCG